MLLNRAAGVCIMHNQSTRRPQPIKTAVRIICMASASLALVCLFAPHTWASERVIERIRFEKVSLTEERVSFGLSEYAPPLVFGLEGERKRLVCDFYDTALKKEIPRSIKTDGTLVTGIRVGIHTAPKRMTRVVLDLAPVDRDYAVEQHFYEDNVFVVTVNLK